MEEHQRWLRDVREALVRDRVWENLIEDEELHWVGGGE